MEIKVVKIDMPEDSNLILLTAHSIKTVEDLYESMMNSVPGLKFGLAFCESSGERLVRTEATVDEFKRAAAVNTLRLGCGHSSIIFMR